ncbi:MAG: NAD(P) transhydrogenase subunit alpha [Planctomycetota bacterium]
MSEPNTKSGRPTTHGCISLHASGIEGEARVALLPEHVRLLVEDGWVVRIPPSLSAGVAVGDAEYAVVGASVTREAAPDPGRPSLDIFVSPPSQDTILALPEHTTVLGFLDPFNRPDLVALLAERGLDSVSLELVPRTTIAQSMDALSSQGNMAGYAAVIAGVARLRKILPMMSTAAGTVRPARVLVVGTGVAGLQAIATAQRLGARVTAYDVRAAAKDQVESLGARFAKIEIGETSEVAGGYATALSDEQLDRQRQQLSDLCAESDLIITTAQVFGKRAPVIVTGEMVARMRPGSVVVDAAIATGGNVEPSMLGEEVEIDGVVVMGDPNLSSRVAVDASRVLGANIVSLLKHIVDPETGRVVDVGGELPDPIASAVLLTRGGEVRDERVRSTLPQHGPSAPRSEGSAS